MHVPHKGSNTIQHRLYLLVASTHHRSSHHGLIMHAVRLELVGLNAILAQTRRIQKKEDLILNQVCSAGIHLEVNSLIDRRLNLTTVGQLQ